uniref:Uncharacterized protein n=1 Tax=Glossina morsitans morsitans TaxID=37546 RepID=A0A1B0G674_GLOMM
MFGQSSLGSTSTNRMNDFEVVAPPEDSVSALEFSPATVQQNFLIAASWDSSVRCWEIEQTGKTVPKSMKTMGGPVLDVCWSDDGTKIFIASEKQVKIWDLASDQQMQIAAHEAPTLKFWDARSPNPMLAINLPERCYCADIDYPMAVVGTAGRNLIIYSLENSPTEIKRQESPLKYQHRTISIFRDKKKAPTGYALGGIEGRVGIQYVNPLNPKDNFTFKCHRSSGSAGFQDIYAVNDIAFHPIHGTLVTVGSDGTFSFWDKDARAKLKSSETVDQSITKCSFNANGQIFAYAVGYDWSR